jgi:hypothetical protein
MHAKAHAKGKTYVKGKTYITKKAYVKKRTYVAEENKNKDKDRNKDKDKHKGNEEDDEVHIKEEEIIIEDPRERSEDYRDRFVRLAKKRTLVKHTNRFFGSTIDGIMWVCRYGHPFKIDAEKLKSASYFCEMCQNTKRNITIDTELFEFALKLIFPGEYEKLYTTEYVSVYSVPKSLFILTHPLFFNMEINKNVSKLERKFRDKKFKIHYIDMITNKKDLARFIIYNAKRDAESIIDRCTGRIIFRDIEKGAYSAINEILCADNNLKEFNENILIKHKAIIGHYCDKTKMGYVLADNISEIIDIDDIKCVPIPTKTPTKKIVSVIIDHMINDGIISVDDLGMTKSEFVDQCNKKIM